jgi:hypothetical protein
MRAQTHAKKSTAKTQNKITKSTTKNQRQNVALRSPNFQKAKPSQFLDNSKFFRKS